jgi:hypothetical protein
MVKVKFSFLYFFVSRVIILGIFCISTDSLAQISSFKIEASKNSGKIDHDIICDIYGDSLIIGVVPNQVGNVNLISTFSNNSSNKVFIGSDEQVSGNTINDFSTPLYYSVYRGDKLIKKYKVEIVNTGLPVVYINTENQAPVVSKDTYINGHIWVYPNDQTAVFSAPMEIRGRGNTTWGLPKSPYKVKLNSKASILGMPSDKEWVLLANYTDKSLIRNSLAFDLSNKMNMAYTPRMFQVDLIFNGRYDGTYLFGEQIKIAEGRLNIEELKKKDTGESLISGGYLFEVNERLDEITWLLTDRKVPITFKSPDEPTIEQFQYIKNYLQRMEDVLYSDTFNLEGGYKKYLNPSTFIDWFWVNEIFKNSDAKFWSSIFLYKNREDRVNMGPVWDFDLAVGNINYTECFYPAGWWVKDNLWLKRLFEDPTFKDSAYNRWNKLKIEVIPYLLEQISNRSNEINKSQRLNFYKWPIQGQYVWPNPIVTESYEDEVNYVRTWLEARIKWIDEQVNSNVSSENMFVSVYPEHNSTHIISNNEDVEFKWGKSENSSIYEVIIDTINGDYMKAIAKFRSESFGFDTTAYWSNSSIKEMFEKLGTGLGEVVKLKWKVYAFNSEGTLLTPSSYSLNLVNAISLENPVSNWGHVKIFPNPTSGSFTIETGNKFDVEHVTLYDLMGQKLEELSFQNSTSSINMDLSAYPKGTYLIYISSYLGERLIQRVIVY